MKKQVAIFFVTALMASMSLAQNITTAKLPDDDGLLRKGIRISLVMPELNSKATLKYNGLSFYGTGKPDSSLGIAIGYASLPVQELG